MGWPTVMIGEVGMGSPVVVTPLEPALPSVSGLALQAQAMAAAAVSGAATVPM